MELLVLNEIKSLVALMSFVDLMYVVILVIVK